MLLNNSAGICTILRISDETHAVWRCQPRPYLTTPSHLWRIQRRGASTNSLGASQRHVKSQHAFDGDRRKPVVQRLRQRRFCQARENRGHSNDILHVVRIARNNKIIERMDFCARPFRCHVTCRALVPGTNAQSGGKHRARSQE